MNLHNVQISSQIFFPSCVLSPKIEVAALTNFCRVLRTLIPLTTKRAIRLSGQDPIHSAADGGQVECLRLLIQTGRDVNALLGAHISGRSIPRRLSKLREFAMSLDARCLACSIFSLHSLTSHFVCSITVERLYLLALPGLVLQCITCYRELRRSQEDSPLLCHFQR